MSLNRILNVLKSGERFYFNDNNSLVIRKINPATEDDHTHYIYFDKRLSLFFEYSKKENKKRWIDFRRVEEIIEVISFEQQQVNGFFNRLSIQ